MNNLEGIIRPFGPGDVFNAKSLAPVSPNVQVKPRITVTIGKATELLMKPIGVTNLFGGERNREVTRRTSTKRVFNEADETQFVDVERIDYLKMRDELTGQEREYNFDNPA